MLTDIACDLKQIRQVKPKSTSSLDSTDRSLQRSRLYVFRNRRCARSHCKVSVQTIKWLSNIASLRGSFSTRLYARRPGTQNTTPRLWFSSCDHTYSSASSSEATSSKCFLVLVLHHHAFSAHQAHRSASAILLTYHSISIMQSSVRAHYKPARNLPAYYSTVPSI